MATQTFYCPRCKVIVNNNNRFCANCGVAFAQTTLQQTNQQFTQPLTKQIKRKNDLMGLWIALGIVGFCGVCGFLGFLQDKNKSGIDLKGTNANLNANISSNIQATPTPASTFADLKTKSESLLKRDNDDISDIKEFDDLMQPLRNIPKVSKDYKEAQILNKKLIDKSAVILAEKLVLGPKPENSAWDGSVLAADRYLKEALNDYSSSEYLSWTTVVKIYVGKEPFWVTKAKIRAKNSFGAYIVKEVVFYIRNEQVVKVQGL